MRRTWRLGVSAAGVLVVVLVTAIAAGASGILGQTSGEYRLDDVNAFAFSGSGPGGPPTVGANVVVEQGTFSFRPGEDGTPLDGHGTVVAVTLFTPTGISSACFLVPDRELVVGKNLSSIRLHTTLVGAEMVTIAPIPLAGSLEAIAGFTGKGGGAGGICQPTTGTFPASLALDITWSATGPLQTLRRDGTFSCAGFHVASNTTMRSVIPAATISVGGTPVDTGFASVASENVRLDVDGPGALPTGCTGPSF